MFSEKRLNSNKNFIIVGLITALCFSAFIYLNYFGIQIKAINTILGLVSFYLLLTISRKSLFVSGFFIGILWCYWMAVSLKYYDLVFLTPILLFAIGLVYAVIFYLFCLYDKITFRILAIIAFSFLSPFGFNWIKPELLFINSYIGTSKIDLLLVLVSLYFFIKLKKLKIIGIIPLIFILSYQENIETQLPNTKIYMSKMNIKQNEKWDKRFRKQLFEKNFEQIQNAIEEKNQLVVLPETTFTTALNIDTQTMAKLIEYSNEIDIITGGLYFEDERIYNATYYISKSNVKIAKKVVLVPFGEEVPLPKIFVDLINDYFYGGAQDYAKASKPTTFKINNEKFRNAICYEATTNKIFENIGDTKYMIVTSNNAWFTPSIEPTLQNLLLQYYSNKYKITILHVVNGSENKIFKPIKKVSLIYNINIFLKLLLSY